MRGEDDEDEEDEEEFSDDEEEYEEFEELVSTQCTLSGPRVVWAKQLLDSQEVDEDDQALLDAYVPQGQLQQGRTLADLIMEKIGQAEDGGKGKEPGKSTEEMFRKR